MKTRAGDQPQFDPERDAENTQRIVERMIRAKWLTGRQLVTPKNWQICLSDLGVQKMDAIGKALLEFSPDYFKSLDKSSLKLPDPSGIQLGKLFLKIEPIFAELRPPAFSEDEMDAALDMFARYARTECGGDDSAARG